MNIFFLLWSISLTPYITVIQRKSLTDRYIQPQLSAFALDALFICVPIWRNPPNPPASTKKRRGESETGRLERKKSQGERQKKRKTEKEKEERERKTPEQKKEWDRRRKAGAGMAQSLSCNVVKHPNRISNDPGRLLPTCFDIPSSVWLVCTEQINDDFHTKDS